MCLLKLFIVVLSTPCSLDSPLGTGTVDSLVRLCYNTICVVTYIFIFGPSASVDLNLGLVTRLSVPLIFVTFSS